MSKQRQNPRGKREGDNRDIFDKALEDYAFPASAIIGAGLGWKYGRRLLRQAGGPAYKLEGPAVKAATSVLGATAGSLVGVPISGHAARRNREREEKKRK